MAKILLVDDNDLTQMVIARLLESKSHEVICAANAEVGIEMAQSENPDIILMDMNLPVIDGLEATRKLKAEPETDAIPVIALTGYDTDEDRVAAREAGCDDFEPKPVELARLNEKIARLVGGR